MPLPFIIAAGVALAAAGYGVKKKVDADILSEETNEYIKYINEGNDLLEEAEEVIKAVASDCEFALARFEEKKCYIRNQVISEFSHHFNQLKGFELINKKGMENIQLYVSDTLKIIDKNLKMSSFDILGAVGNAVGNFSVGFGLAAGGIVGSMGLVAGPALAIFLGALSADEMEKKRDDAKAYLSQVEAAVKKADVIVDNLQAVRKMVGLFTRQITKWDALFFSLSQDAIATMKKHHYDTSRYNQKEKDQLCVTVSTLFSLSAFLKATIMDEHQKLNKKAQNALNLMRNQINALESAQKSGRYDVAMIQSNQKDFENL
ncbi:sortase [Helicobacter pylori]|uniref:sortase n=1 Tax=Helicobacter pylori TaxID=210 RepID=UPI000EAB7717|nr:sortase [Helicobacter pylori]